MFDIAPSEFLICAVVALLVIGPKDLPKAMRVVGHWVGKARGMARHFRSGIDEMVRQSELEEMEKKWQEENARIMASYAAKEPKGLPQPSDDAMPPDEMLSTESSAPVDAPATPGEKPA